VKQGVEQRRSNADVSLEGCKNGELALIVLEAVGHEPDGPTVALRDEAGEREHVDVTTAHLKGPGRMHRA
jgi:hypothetical protein